MVKVGPLVLKKQLPTWPSSVCTWVTAAASLLIFLLQSPLPSPSNIPTEDDPEAQDLGTPFQYTCSVEPPATTQSTRSGRQELYLPLFQEGPGCGLAYPNPIWGHCLGFWGSTELLATGLPPRDGHLPEKGADSEMARKGSSRPGARLSLNFSDIANKFSFFDSVTEDSSNVLFCWGFLQSFLGNPNWSILPFQNLLFASWYLYFQMCHLLSALTLQVLAQCFPLSSPFPNKSPLPLSMQTHLNSSFHLLSALIHFLYSISMHVMIDSWRCGYLNWIINLLFSYLISSNLLNFMLPLLITKNSIPLLISSEISEQIKYDD